jgi:hypothetical protein
VNQPSSSKITYECRFLTEVNSMQLNNFGGDHRFQKVVLLDPDFSSQFEPHPKGSVFRNVYPAISIDPGGRRVIFRKILWLE